MTFVHGFTQRGASWEELWSLLPDGRRLVAVDLPGHGDSPDTGATLPEAARALTETWDALGITESALVGYSLGGRLALYSSDAHRLEDIAEPGWPLEVSERSVAGVLEALRG